MIRGLIIGSLQYITSGVMGGAAFAGGLVTALLGLIIEFMMTIIIAGIFIFSTDRILLPSWVAVGNTRTSHARLGLARAMIALGCAKDDLRCICFAANFYKMGENLVNRSWSKNSVEIHGQRVMYAIPWL